MDPRNYKSGAAGSPPAEPVSPSNGYPTEGNPVEGIPATNPGPFWYYKIGESLRNVITSAGLTPSDSDLTLLQQAILKLVSATNHVVRLEDVTFGPSVSDGDAVYWDNTNSRYDQAIADGTDKQKVVGFADVSNSIVEAFGRSSLFSGLTASTRYYLSGSTAGAITATAPSEKVIVGLAKSATVLFVDIDPIDKGLGEGQTWQDVSASRSPAVTYTNTTGRPIAISAGTIEPATQALSIVLTVDGNAIARNSVQSATTNGVACVFGVIPNGSTYSVSLGANESIDRWWELR